MEEEKKDKPFVVRDKRLFAETGEQNRKDEPAAAKQEQATEPSKQPDSAATSRAETTGEDILPQINFFNFILSLSTTAMFHFGDFPDPESQKPQKNLAAAKQTIDILGMLKDKTSGNLDEDEKSLIEGILFELRMRYVREKDRP